MAKTTNKISVEIDLFDCNENEIIAFVQKNYSPDDVFPKDELIQWATNNGFTPTDYPHGLPPGDVFALISRVKRLERFICEESGIVNEWARKRSCGISMSDWIKEKLEHWLKINSDRQKGEVE